MPVLLAIVGAFVVAGAKPLDTLEDKVGFGLLGYLAILVVALAALQPRWLADRRPDVLVGLLSGVGVAFSLYLTYAELFILRAVCQWCVVSQLLIIGIFVLALVGVWFSISNDRHPTPG